MHRFLILFAFFCTACSEPLLDTLAPITPSSTSSPQLRKYIKDCTLVDDSSALCRNEISFQLEDIKNSLNDSKFGYWTDGDTLNLVAISDKDNLRLTGTVQEGMFKLKTDAVKNLWGASYRLTHLDESIIKLRIRGAPRGTKQIIFIGDNAPKPFDTNVKIQGRLKTISITSKYLKINTPRKLTIYTPPEYDKDKFYSVVYMSDGNSAKQYAAVIDTLISSKKMRPVILVGLWAGIDKDDMKRGGLRAREYLLGYEKSPFDAHEKFFINDVIPYIETRYSVKTHKKDRLLFGFSNGADWVLAMAIRHPDLFSQVAAASVVGISDYIFEDNPDLHLYLQAGHYEPIVLKSAKNKCSEAVVVGINCIFSSHYSGHESAIWQHHLATTLKQVYPKE